MNNQEQPVSSRTTLLLTYGNLELVYCHHEFRHKDHILTCTTLKYCFVSQLHMNYLNIISKPSVHCIYLYLFFIYVSLFDADGSPDYTAENYRIDSENELRRMWKKVVMA
jgi:hypothetical protein